MVPTNLPAGAQEFLAENSAVHRMATLGLQASTVPRKDVRVLNAIAISIPAPNTRDRPAHKTSVVFQVI